MIRVPALTAIVALVVAGFVGVGSPAVAAGTATVQGVVTGAVPSMSQVAANLWHWNPLTREYEGPRNRLLNHTTGAYSFTGVESGEYVLCFHDSQSNSLLPDRYVDNCLDGAVELDEAVRFTVAEGATVIKDTTLVVGGSLEGTIEFPNGIDSGGVTAYSVDEPDRAEYHGLGFDAYGGYFINGLPPGRYVLLADPLSGLGRSIYVKEFLVNAPTLEEATVYTVASGQQTYADQVMTLGGVITGRVVEAANGVRIDGTTVTAFVETPTGRQVEYSVTADGNGEYSLFGMPAGSYTIRFESLYRGFATQYYTGTTTGTSDYTAATPVEVELGETVSGIDAKLAVGAQASGRVLLNGQQPFSAYVHAERRESGGAWDRLPPWPVNFNNGYFTMKGLAPGTYRFLITGRGASEYWGDTFFADEAELVTVGAGGAANLNVDMVDAAKLAIHYWEKDGDDAAPGTEYTLEYEKSPGVWKEFTPLPAAFGAAPDGFDRIPVGTYRLSFVDNPGYTDQWYDAKGWDGVATPIVLTSGDEVDTYTLLSDDLFPVDPTPQPTISGTPRVGAPLTAVPGTWGPPGVSLTYTWSVDGVERQTGAAATFTPLPGDEGEVVEVAVAGSRTGFISQIRASVPSAPIQLGVLAPAPTPTISGTPRVGVALTANPGTWGPAPVNLSYQWSVAGVERSGAVANTFTPEEGDQGKTVTVSVAGEKPGYAPAVRTSAVSAVVAAPLISPAGTPSVTGTPQVGRTLTAATGAWAPGATFGYQWLVGGSVRSGATGPTFVPTATDAGRTVSVRVTGSKPGFASVTTTSTASAAVAPAPKARVVRLSGTSRYDTAVAVSRQFDPNVQRVYIATGAGYADALGAAAAAAHFDSPLLLTAPGALPAAVRSELIRLAPDEIVVVGGPSVVSQHVQDQLAALAFDPAVSRIFGADRYETSRLIAADAFGGDDLSTAYIADGRNFPDALAAGPAAAHVGGPVLLVKGSDVALETPTSALLSALDVEVVKVAGGTGAVSAGIASQLAGAGFTVTRLAGADRYATAVAINADAFATAERIYLATGQSYADALAGAALAAHDDAPLFVTRQACIPPSVLVAIGDLGPADMTLLGGTGALGTGVALLRSC